MRLLHIIAGVTGLISGAVALSALKGAKLHRQSGMLFVYAMLVMSASGALMAALKPQRLSMVGGLLAIYLVITALLTVRRPVQGACWTDAGAMLVALMVGIAGFKFGLEALNSPTGTIDGIPSAIGFMHGAVALLAMLGDVRMMLGRRIQRTHRIARHLWRMCFALWIATGSFFLGQTQMFPETLRIPALLAIPAFLPLLLMSYWLWRVRIKRTPGAMAGAGSHEVNVMIDPLDETAQRKLSTVSRASSRLPWR